ncbi:hypothetical protein PI125_g23470 [Phytophthora idaei]|nr:hypothetical protein PI125_g23470 [Phytophthora idaei]
MLRKLSPTEQHGVALDFIVKDQRDAAAVATTTASSGTTPRVQSLKLHVRNYVRKEGEPLLRFLVESTLPSRLDESSTNRRRSRSPCHVLADERGAGRMDAGSRTLVGEDLSIGRLHQKNTMVVREAILQDQEKQTCKYDDHTCFSTYAEFKEELSQAFEPPKNEFQSRAEFLDLRQGKHDVHAYAKRSRTSWRTR